MKRFTVIIFLTLALLSLPSCKRNTVDDVKSAGSEQTSAFSSSEYSSSVSSNTLPSYSKVSSSSKATSEMISSYPARNTTSGVLSSAAESIAAPLTENSPKITATLRIETPDGIMADFKQEIEEGETAFSILKKYADLKGLRLQYSSFGGVYIKSFAGYSERADGHPGSGWIFYMNGTKGTKSASKIVLQKGDIVLWKYSYTALSE